MYNIVTLILLVYTGELAAKAFRAYRRKLRLANWPLTEAKVYSVSRASHASVWRVQYFFELDRQSYGGKEKISRSSVKKMITALAALKPGDSVSVRYDPKAPDRSIIDYEASGFLMRI